jgi:outer membrane protein W
MKSILIFFLTLCIAVTARSQSTRSFSSFNDLAIFSWEIAFPHNNDYVGKTSLTGWRFEYRKMVRPNVSVGLALSSNYFDDYFPSKTYTSGDGKSAVTTDMVRQVFTMPLTLVSHYYMGKENKNAKPFLGIGIGGQFTELNSFFNVYEIQEKNWGFVVRPEFGAIFRMGQGIRGLLSIGYNLSTNHYDAFNLTGENQFVINLGIGMGR